MGILEGNPVPFIEDDSVLIVLIDEFYLVQGHTLKKDPNDSLVFFYLGYVPLPNVGYHLYNCRSLAISFVPQEEACQHSVSGLPGKITRSRARREGLQQPQPQPSHQHEAGGSSWQSASFLTLQLGELNVRANNIDGSLGQHI